MGRPEPPRLIYVMVLSKMPPFAASLRATSVNSVVTCLFSASPVLLKATFLVGRKTARDGATQALALAEQIARTEADLMAVGSDDAQAMASSLKAAREAFQSAAQFIAANASANPNAAFAGSVPYLMLTGNVMAGWQMARALLAVEGLSGDEVFGDAFLQAKRVTCRFYADHILTKVPGLRDSIVQGADSVNAMALEAF